MRGIEFGWEEETAWLVVTKSAMESPEWSELADLLGLDGQLGRYRLTAGIGEGGGGDEIHVVPRSLNSAFFYLSHAVDVPEVDSAAGRVTITRRPDGDEFDWSAVTGDLLAVRWSAEEPVDAAVRTRYRGRWFYLDDADLSSKSTFSMLTQLFQLQGGDVPSQGPLLTLPVSR
jgi:hypothetical protein